ncbi:MAG: YkgJ family cysteine cluster protein [Fusobacteriaceae bacterium]
MTEKIIFDCDKCGICCKNLNKNEIYATLNRGDGICKNLDEHKNLCKIYNERPLLCNVVEAYKKLFSGSLSYEKYEKLNKESCKILRDQNNEKRKNNERKK